MGMFVLCTIPPILWNAQHAWITLAHLRSRGNLDRGFGIHPAEVLSFLGQHFIVYSPLLFLALVWGVIESWRRIDQQFKVLFLMWFGLPVFVFYLLLSINKSAAPNWDGLAFLVSDRSRRISGGNGFRRAFFYAYAPASPSWWD